MISPMAQHVPWTEIESFHNIRKLIAAYPVLCCGSPVTYKAKVKLHGTNAGIMISHEGTVTAISRTAILSPGHDNAGFAAWVAVREESLRELAPARGTLVIFGEWCGPGIQKGVAVTQISERVFAIFAGRIVVTDPSDPDHGDDDFIVDPSALERFRSFIPGAYVIPWFNDGEEFTVDWHETGAVLQPILDRINGRVAEVERCDPWIAKQFGVEGIGEGLVFYPMSTHMGYENFTNLCFKAKGEKHQVVAHSKPAQADPNVVASAAAFAEMVVTPSRLEQGARAVGGGELQFNSKSIGAFLGWISTDVTKETQAELEASGLDLKTALKACGDRARTWYVTEMKKL